MLRWLSYGCTIIGLTFWSGVSHAQTPRQDASSLCPTSALARVVRHRIVPGETLVSLAQRYNLIPATLMGMNPALRNGRASVGTEILIPPYNGIRVEVPAGRSWRDVAESYGVRADVLFEVNGCQPEPRVVFVPGVNWTPSATPTANQGVRILQGYPLPAAVPIISGYGWQVEPNSGQVIFNSGVDLAAAAGTPVLAVGEGVVAFAEQQGNYGNLVVINHQEGLQTRYAHLGSISVQVGQAVKRGDRIGNVGATGAVANPRLHFEVRSNSNLGWVAQNPSLYLQNLAVGR